MPDPTPLKSVKADDNAKAIAAPAAMPRVVLLGPQRLRPTITEHIARLGLAGKFALVTAGWQEREAEDTELVAAVGGNAVNLNIHARGDTIFRDDPELFDAHRRRQDVLRHLQTVYRLRLNHAVDAVEDLRKLNVPAELRESQLVLAMESIRQLENVHIEGLTKAHADFDHDWKPLERRAVAKQRDELKSIIDECVAVAIAGGNVAVVLNRMKLVGLGALIKSKPVFAWSAGAMALGQRIVLFHDNSAQGPRNAELFDEGLGLYNGVVPFPHARKRLNLHDRARAAMLARRAMPMLCIPMDEGACLSWDGRVWTAEPGTYQINLDGEVMEMHA